MCKSVYSGALCEVRLPLRPSWGPKGALSGGQSHFGTSCFPWSQAPVTKWRNKLSFPDLAGRFLRLLFSHKQIQLAEYIDTAWGGVAALNLVSFISLSLCVVEILGEVPPLCDELKRARSPPKPRPVMKANKKIYVLFATVGYRQYYYLFLRFFFARNICVSNIWSEYYGEGKT